MSTTNEPRDAHHEPKPMLKVGTIYSGDNGRLMCVECAGISALYTKHDLSGHRVVAVAYTETVQWHATFNKPMSCECGRTVYLLPTWPRT